MLSSLGIVCRIIYNGLKGDEQPVPYLPMTTSPWPLAILTILYLAFTFKIGPALMKNRAAFKLRGLLMCYNIFQVIVNAYIFYVCCCTMIRYPSGDAMCILPYKPDHSMYHREATFTYLYFLNKIFDFLDTIFFVLRKNFRQVTFLHVYHHAIMVWMPYIFYRYDLLGGHANVLGILNCLVHALMYFYYFLSIKSETAKRSIWWKKYITIVQLVQFSLLLVHNAYPLLFRPDCQVPKMVHLTFTVQASFMMVLFLDFYKKAYCQKTKKSQ